MDCLKFLTLVIQTLAFLNQICGPNQFFFLGKEYFLNTLHSSRNILVIQNIYKEPC